MLLVKLLPEVSRLCKSGCLNWLNKLVSNWLFLRFPWTCLCPVWLYNSTSLLFLWHTGVIFLVVPFLLAAACPGHSFPKNVLSVPPYTLCGPWEQEEWLGIQILNMYKSVKVLQIDLSVFTLLLKFQLFAFFTKYKCHCFQVLSFFFEVSWK